MATILGRVISRDATTAVTRGHCVKWDATATFALATAASDVFAGIAVNTVAIGDGCSVQQTGIMKGAVAGAAIASLLTELTINASGRLIAATTGDKIVGRNLTTAAADGDEIEVELIPHGALKL